MSHTLPLGARRDGKTRVELVGWNLSGRVNCQAECEPAGSDRGAETWRFQPTGVENALSLSLGDGDEAMEPEPDDAATVAMSLSVPGAVTGRIDRAGDEDRFRFVATKGQRLKFAVQSASLGFSLDAWLKVEDTNTTQLARNDDKGGADPELEWTAPGDGPFVVAVGNLLHRGGSNALYRLSLAELTPDFVATIGEHGVVLKAGETNEIKVTVNRLHGFTNQITISAGGLPEGVSMAPVDVSAKGGDQTLKLAASTNAAPHGGVFRIVARSGDLERPVVHSFVSKSENNGVPGGYRELVIPATDKLWLT
jgi:hypothetical protein